MPLAIVNRDFRSFTKKQTNKLSTLLFVNEQVIIADTEDNLQKAVHKLNQIIKQ